MSEAYGKSPLVAALNKRERRTFEYEIAALVGAKDCKLPGKVRLRVLTKDEQDSAIVAADVYVKRKTAAAPDAAKDPELYRDIKTVHALHAAIRMHESDVPGVDLPAFISPEWMAQKFNTIDLATMLNAYNACVAADTKLVDAMPDDAVESVLASLAASAGTDMPNLALVPYEREQVAEVLIRAAVKLRDARATAAAAAPPV